MLSNETKGQGSLRISTGSASLDALVGGGLPRGSLLGVTGPIGRGPLRLAAGLLAAHTAAGEWAGVIDLPGTLHPPGLHAAGVVLERLLVLRPGDSARAGRAMEELLRHGSFRLVLARGLQPAAALARRLLLAAEAGRSVGALVLDSLAAGRVRSATRLEAEREPGGLLRVRVLRARGGAPGGQVMLEEHDGPDGLRLVEALPITPPLARASGA